MIRNALTVWLLLAASALGQTPRAIITGPKEAASGDLVILDASQSTGQKYLWKMLEADKSFLPTDNNLRCVFAAGVDKERTFHFVLIAAGTNPNGSPEVDIATHDLTMKPRGQVIIPDVPENPTVPVSPNQKVTRLTYVYEKDQSSIPKAVERAISAVNADSSGSVVASSFEHDSTNGSDKVPSQYKVAVEAANKAGLPCLVAQAGDVVVKVVGNPKTEAEVREAAGVRQ